MCNVMIGNQGAIIFHIDPNGELIKCMIPPGKGRLPVWICNSNVYTRFDYFSYSDEGAKAGASTREHGREKKRRGDGKDSC